MDNVLKVHKLEQLRHPSVDTPGGYVRDAQNLRGSRWDRPDLTEPTSHSAVAFMLLVLLPSAADL